MSVKVMGMVWDMELSKDEKFVLLAYADHADHDGNNIYPAVKTIAKKCGYSERSIQRITRTLQSNGLLVAHGGQTGGMGVTANWSIPLRGDKIAPFERVTSTTQRVTKRTQRVTSTTAKGDIAVSPEPSITKKEPSLNHPSSAEKTPAAILTPMVEALANVTGMDKRINYGRIAKEAKQFITAEYAPETITQLYGQGGKWYSSDWRGQKGQPPTLAQIRETIGSLPKTNGNSAAPTKADKRAESEAVVARLIAEAEAEEQRVAKVMASYGNE